MTAVHDESAIVARELLVIERRLWTNDAEFYERTLVPDALLVFAETGVLTRAQAVAAIREENRMGRRWGSVEIAGLRAIHLGRDAWLITYGADAQRQGETARHRALCSSAYVRAGDRWMLGFHQQSALAVHEE